MRPYIFETKKIWTNLLTLLRFIFFNILFFKIKAKYNHVDVAIVDKCETNKEVGLLLFTVMWRKHACEIIRKGIKDHKFEKEIYVI